MSLTERMQDRRFQLSLGMVLCLLAALLLWGMQGGDGLSRKILDRQFSMLHEYAARPLARDVVVVGIDEASLRKFREPFALWHPHLERFLRAMVVAEPAVVGLDVELPEYSYQSLLPGYEDGLIQSLRELRMHVPVVLARKPNPDGSLRTFPASMVATDEEVASVVLCLDPDGVMRRFDPNRCTVNAQGTTFAERITARLGMTHPGTGLVDFAAGGKLDFIPFDTVYEWQARGETGRLLAAFSGKPVLLGVVSAREGLVSVPVPLAVRSPMARQVPEVLVQAQILRSMTGAGLVREVPAWIALCMMFAAALFWVGRSGWLKLLALAVLSVMLGLFSTWLLGQGVYLPLGSVLLSALFAFLARLGYDTLQQMRERSHLRALFDSYVSRKVMQSILSGRIESPDSPARVRVCLLYARVCGFNDRVKGSPAQEAVDLLNACLNEMAIAIRQNHGTLDGFDGSDFLAFFGAPQVLECPERSALETAQEMLLRLREVNQGLREQAQEPLEIVIAVHAGEVVVGHVGPESRRSYTVLGSEVDMVRALAGWMEGRGHSVVCSAGVAAAVEIAKGFTDCGEHDVGGMLLHLYGWHPPLLEKH